MRGKVLYMRKFRWFHALFLALWLTSSAFANVYVKNKLFKGGVAGKGAATTVEAESMLKALEVSDYRIEDGQLLLGEKILKLEAGMVSLKDLTDALGAKMVVNASLGTVDVYQPAEKEDGAKSPGSWGAATWHTSWESAAAESSSSGKPVMLFFTGSDWCGWCKKLKREVFDTSEFQSWAARKVVLLELDFPRGKPQSSQLKAANQRLAQKFGVQGYPSVYFANAKGTPLGSRFGYVEGGPSVWTRQAEQFMRSR